MAVCPRGPKGCGGCGTVWRNSMLLTCGKCGGTGEVKGEPTFRAPRVDLVAAVQEAAQQIREHVQRPETYTGSKDTIQALRDAGVIPSKKL